MSGDKNPLDALQGVNSIENLTDQVKQEADDFIDDVKEEIIEAKDNFIQEIKDTIMGLGNSIFGDFKLFWSIVKTISQWIIKPISLNVRDIERENLKRAGEGLKARYFTDFNLMKSIFMLSLTFLVVEEVATNATEEEWISQVVFFLFFVALLFVFIGAMWLWKRVVGIKTRDARVFIGFLIYQYATIYIISFIVNGPLGLNVSSDESNTLIFFVYFLPLIQSCYFLIKLMNYYQLRGFRKGVGFVLGFVFLMFFLFLPSSINEVFLIDGITGE
ncbi:hypothetical protein BFP97_04530 [Roseivirga sp. 4D4]|uniref:hypothetical protein n=1 Tax=Roseivirga sp. 4D4 TaxID=1889784 RepID=UPI000853B90A|nr:hypothetical protein [Roseivirga sp. 4D4]OEK00819.1 hypothetical protein BFP97_04530 [Roseivirga sp. 4D4]